MSTTGVQGYTVNLGEVAITKTLQAVGSVICPNFQQPDQTTGSLLASNATVTQAYVSGINKYIFYYTGGASGASFSQTFVVTGFPTQALQTYTPSVSASAVFIGGVPIVGTYPVFTNSITGISPTSPTLSSITANVVTSTAPTFSGTGVSLVWKVVIMVNSD